MAAVVLETRGATTEAELIGFAADRLPPHERPAGITFVDALPRNSVGKLLREDLRARLAEAAST